MKIKKFIAVALAATMLSTAACGLIACDKDAVEIGGIVGGIIDGATTEYTVSFNANGGSTTATPMTTTGGKLTGTMPTASKGDDYEFLGWATTSTATAAEITASNFNGYVFSGTAKTVTLYAVYKLKDNGKKDDDDDNGDDEETTHALYVNDTLVANLTAGTADEDEDTTDLVWGWYATDILFYAGDKVTFTADGAEKDIVAMEAQEKTAIDGAGTIIEGTQVEVSQDGVFTVEFTQWANQVENKRCRVYIGASKSAAIEGDYYVVGENYGNWSTCLPRYHIDPVTGEVEITVSAGDAIKLAKANSEGGINWDGSERGADAVTVGRGYISADGDGNIVFTIGGTYTLKLVDGSIEITSDEVEEPDIPEADWIAGDYYVVGESAQFGSWGSCLKNNHVGKTDGEIEITVSAGAAIKLAKANSTGGVNWDDNPLGTANVTVGKEFIRSGADNITFISAGTYTIKLTGGHIEIYSDVEAPELYPYGPVAANKYYLVGAFGGKAYDFGNGFAMLESVSSVTGASEYNMEGFTVEAGAAIMIRHGSGDSVGIGYDQIDVDYGQINLVTRGENNEIVFKQAGTYNIYYNPTEGKIYLSK
ncbi:MAG: InlB B-repeat-containing protein [Clostridiales bacterium]|nr:InlB B-repeat-containing protein [Clostridiales bacterium]